MLIFCCRECKETKFFHTFSPPNTHFPPKTCISVLPKPVLSLFQFPQTICIDALFIGWFIWRSQKWLTFTSNIFYSKGFPVFHHNLCANGANCNVYRAWFGSSATLRNTNIVEELSWYARLRPKSRNFFKANLLLCELQKFGGLSFLGIWEATAVVKGCFEETEPLVAFQRITSELINWYLRQAQGVLEFQRLMSHPVWWRTRETREAIA